MLVHRVVEGVTVFLVWPGTAVKVSVNDDCADLRNLFHVRIPGAFRVNVCGGQREIMACRRVYLTPLGVPCKGTTILFRRNRRKLRRVVRPFQLGGDVREVDHAMDIPRKRDAMVYPTLCPIRLLIKAMVNTIRVAMGNEDGRQVVWDYVRLSFLVTIVTFCFCPKRLFIPVVLRDDRMFIRVVVECFYYRVAYHPFRACAKSNDASGGLFSFLDLGIRSYGSEYPCPLTFFLCNDYVRLRHDGQFKRAYARMRTLITYPAIEMAMALRHCQVSNFCIEVVNGVPVRNFPRVRRGNDVNF